MAAYYNEIDPFAAAWLRELIKEGLIADGEVDERDIRDVQASDVRGFTQCHFFAGIGGWSYALRLAGWDDARPIWTGSCPCQPFSVAGKRRGDTDVRDLWPIWFRLIRERSPSVVFGEQVAGKDGLRWLARVHADVESAAFAFGAADLPAACVSAPHIRQRAFFVADRGGSRRQQDTGRASRDEAPDGRTRWDTREPDGDYITLCDGEGADVGLADGNRCHRQWWSGPVQVGRNAIAAEITRGGRQYRAQWRVKPGVRLVVDGVSNRVERLCGAGNAIVPQVAAEVIRAYMEIVDLPRPAETEETSR